MLELLLSFMERKKVLFYKNVYRNTESKQWTRIAENSKVNKLIIIGYVEKLKDIAARSLKRGYVEKDDIGKIAYQSLSLKKANTIFALLLEEGFLSITEREDLFYITNWHLYQDDITNFQEDFDRTAKECSKAEDSIYDNETQEERTKRHKREWARQSRKSRNVEKDVENVEKDVEKSRNNFSTNGGYKGEEKRKEEKQKSFKKTNKKDFDSEFEKFWNEYPRKVAKEKARQIFSKILRTSKAPETLFNSIIFGLKGYNSEIQTKQTKPEFIAHPSTWLNQQRWEDEAMASDSKHDDGMPKPGDEYYELWVEAQERRKKTDAEFERRRQEEESRQRVLAEEYRKRREEGEVITVCDQLKTESHSAEALDCSRESDRTFQIKSLTKPLFKQGLQKKKSEKDYLATIEMWKQKEKERIIC